jgi:5,10-methylenetetrahydromethanopterin reductase
MQITLGLQSNKSLETYGRIAANAERLGFDGISVFSDLGFQPSLPALLEVARHSTTLRIGPACFSPTLTHPVEIAGQIAMLDHASHGRAYLGLARGSWMHSIGLSRVSSLARLTEAVEVVRYLLLGERDGYNGEFFTIAEGFTFHYPRFRPTLDFLLGTWGPKGLRLGAREFAEVKLGGCANPKMAALARRELNEEAAELGSPHIGLVCGAVTVIDHDGAKARHLARKEVALYLDIVATLDRTYEVPREILDALHSALSVSDYEKAGRCIPDEVLTRFAIAGTPSEIVSQAEQLFDSGVERLEFGTPHGVDEIEGIELLGKHVLPAFRHS